MNIYIYMLIRNFSDENDKFLYINKGRNFVTMLAGSIERFTMTALCVIYDVSGKSYHI